MSHKRTINKVTIDSEALDSLHELKKSYGFRSLSQLFSYIGHSASNGDLYIMPGMSNTKLRDEQKEREETLIRFTAREEVLKTLYENGFIASPYER